MQAIKVVNKKTGVVLHSIPPQKGFETVGDVMMMFGYEWNEQDRSWWKNRRRMYSQDDLELVGAPVKLEGPMTVLERIRAAMVRVDYDRDDVDKLIALAYQIGREEATREVSDDYNKLITEQNVKADRCRYRHMAHEIVGDKKYIYHSEYAGDVTETFGSDETRI